MLRQERECECDRELCINFSMHAIKTHFFCCYQKYVFTEFIIIFICLYGNEKTHPCVINIPFLWVACWTREKLKRKKKLQTYLIKHKWIRKNYLIKHPFRNFVRLEIWEISQISQIDFLANFVCVNLKGKVFRFELKESFQAGKILIS